MDNLALVDQHARRGARGGGGGDGLTVRPSPDLKVLVSKFRFGSEVVGSPFFVLVVSYFSFSLS